MRWPGCIFLLAIPLAAQSPGRTLTLEQAIAAGLAHNPRIIAARHDLEAADARIKLARAELYPRITFGAIAKAGLSGATNALGLVGLPNSPFYRNFAASLNLSQTVFDFGRRAALIDAERRSRDAAAADLADTQASVKIGVERTYWRLLRAQHLRSVEADVLKARNGAVRQAEIFYEAQYRSHMEVDTTRFALATIERRVAEQESEVERLSAELSAAMGTEETNIYALSDENLEIHPPGAISELVQLAFLHRPDLEALRARHQVAAANLRFARSLRRPSLHLALTGGYARVPSLLLQELTAAGAGFTAPLFTGGSIDAQIEAATAQLASRSSQEEAMRQRIGLEVRTALLAYQEKSDALAEFASRVALTRAALRLATERHREGMASGVELDNANAEFTGSLVQSEAARIDVQIARADLLFSTGQL